MGALPRMKFSSREAVLSETERTLTLGLWDRKYEIKIPTGFRPQFANFLTKWFHIWLWSVSRNKPPGGAFWGLSQPCSLHPPLSGDWLRRWMGSRVSILCLSAFWGRVGNTITKWILCPRWWILKFPQFHSRPDKALLLLDCFTIIIGFQNALWWVCVSHQRMLTRTAWLNLWCAQASPHVLIKNADSQAPPPAPNSLGQ